MSDNASPVSPSYRLINHMKICALVPAQDAMVLLFHCVLYEGMPPASGLFPRPSLLSPLGHGTWLVRQQDGPPGVLLIQDLMSTMWVIALVVLSMVLSILDPQRSYDHLQYVDLHHI
jgi:hypothetical protein